MDRFTTDTPKDNTETMLNYAYAEDKWSEINSKVGNASNNSNDEMMMIDAILDEILPSGVVKDGIGYEPFK